MTSHDMHLKFLQEYDEPVVTRTPLSPRGLGLSLGKVRWYEEMAKEWEIQKALGLVGSHSYVVCILHDTGEYCAELVHWASSRVAAEVEARNRHRINMAEKVRKFKND